MADRQMAHVFAGVYAPSKYAESKSMKDSRIPKRHGTTQRKDKFVDLVISVPTVVYEEVAESLHRERNPTGVRELSVILLKEYARAHQR